MKRKSPSEFHDQPRSLSWGIFQMQSRELEPEQNPLLTSQKSDYRAAEAGGIYGLGYQRWVISTDERTRKSVCRLVDLSILTWKLDSARAIKPTKKGLLKAERQKASWEDLQKSVSRYFPKDQCVMIQNHP